MGQSGPDNILRKRKFLFEIYEKHFILLAPLQRKMRHVTGFFTLLLFTGKI